MNTSLYFNHFRKQLLPGALFAVLLLVVGCKPIFTFKKNFHGLYTNHRPHRISMEYKRLEFLPEHRFLYNSDDGCTLNFTRGVGTYRVNRNKVLLRFERHPEDVDGINPKNMHYLEAGDSMSLPIRHRISGGFLVGQFRKKHEQ